MNTLHRLWILMAIIAATFQASGLLEGQESSLPYQDNLLSALFSPAVLNDLELVDDQRAEIKAAMNDIVAYRKNLLSELKTYSQSGASKTEIQARQSELKTEIENKKAETLKLLDQVLLPHQMKRLKQSTVQVMMKHTAKQQKVESGLLTPQMLEYLEIDKAQADKIREEAKKLREALAEKIKKLNEEATEKLLEQLNSKQRKKYKELIGDKLKDQ